MSSGISLIQHAEGLFAQGKIQETFDMYQKSVRKILKDEVVTAEIPAIVTNDAPQETLGFVWKNFLGFFRDPDMNFTKASDPAAYKLLNSFRPSAPKSHPRLERTPRGKILLKGMQITAGLTLGLLAWDERDRATAAKRFKEALDLAATHPPFTAISPDTVGLERYVCKDVQQSKNNLDLIMKNDAEMAQMLAGWADDNRPERRQAYDLPMPQARIGKSGEVTVERSVMFATDACAKCGKRGVKLMRCSLCKKMPYCGSECQRADWRAHKASSCVRLRQ